MNKISIEKLNPGVTAEYDYYDVKGVHLIAKGAKIDYKHIERLKTRGIEHVFFSNNEQKDDLSSILNTEFSNIDLSEDTKSSDGNDFSSFPERKAIENKPELKSVQKGKEGFEKLLKSKKTSAVENSIKANLRADKPAGQPLSEASYEIDVSERTPEYKKGKLDDYESSSIQLKNTLYALINDESINAKPLRSISEKFVDTFVSDKNILLNLSYIKCRERNYIINHSLNVCLLAINIAASYGYNREQIVELAMGSLVFDIGMLLLPEELIDKRGKLNSGDLFEIRKHPILSLHLLENIKGLPVSIPIMAYQSHERENGTGYPKGRKGRLIHNYAKIIQIADIYDSLTSPRNYRKAHTPYNAMEMLVKMTRKGFLNGELVKAFLKYASLFPVGSLARLSTGELSKVVKANGTSYVKPVISVISDKDGNPLKPESIYQINLKENSDIYITEALSNELNEKVGIMKGF